MEGTPTARKVEIKMTQRENLQNSLLDREKQIMLSDIKEVFDRAVDNTCERGVAGPGTGAAFVEHQVVNALKERMGTVAIELATIELGEKQVFEIQKRLADQYEELVIKMMSVPAAWGKEGSVEQVNHKKQWEERSRGILDSYFESELRVAIKKRSLARRFDFKTTLLWIFVGALVGNIGRVFDLILKIADRFLK